MNTKQKDFINKVVKVVDELQEWIEDTDGLHTIPVVSFRWSRNSLDIFIGTNNVWNDEDEDELTFGICKENWLEYLKQFRQWPSLGE